MSDQKNKEQNIYMKTQKTKDVLLKKGLTLIELTVVIVVLLSLISVLFVGVSAWRNGANRATCIVNQRNFQQSVRAWANLNNVTVGNGIDLDSDTVNDDIMTLLITDQFVAGTGATASVTCPLDQSAYIPNPSGNDATDGDLVPVVGQLWYTCTNAAAPDSHVPSDLAGW